MFQRRSRVSHFCQELFDVRQQESSSQTLCEPGRNGSAAPASPPLAEPWGAEELAATLDSAGTAIWAVDLEGCCVFINQAACHIFGRTREECLGQKLHCRIHRGHPAGWHRSEEHTSELQSRQYLVCRL